MLRVSTTNLESFRRVVATEFGDEAELIASIQGKPFKANWRMQAGKTWHHLLETGRPDSGARHTFAPDAVEDAREHLGPGLWEVKAVRCWQIGKHDVNVVAQADHVHGLGIQENKTKFGQCKAEDYEPSLQWRFYLAVHGACWVRYNLFAFRDPAENGYCVLNGISAFRFWPYWGLDAECATWLTRFIEWAESRGLLGYLEREGSSPTFDAL